jgi:RNA polymerase sigma-70 factor (ECF subfamily)
LNKVGNILDQEDANIRLWINFKAGDPDAFGQLAQVHYRALFNYGTRFSADSDFVKDCIQELYLELWERRTFLSETSFVKSYLLKALRHKLIKESIRLKRFHESPDVAFDTDAASPSLEADIIDSENVMGILKKLNHIVASLTKRQQEIIYLRFYQNLENEDIAKIMGLGRQSVSNLLYRTIREIKENWIPVEFCLALFLLI